MKNNKNIIILLSAFALLTMLVGLCAYYFFIRFDRKLGQLKGEDENQQVLDSPEVLELKPNPVSRSEALTANETRPQELKNSQISQREIHALLEDPDHLIQDDFKIPEGLKKRVEFWFDIYSKYTSQQHVIHDMDYPHVIYEVIDGTNLFPQAKNRVQKAILTERYVKESVKRINLLIGKFEASQKVKLSSIEKGYFNKWNMVKRKQKQKQKIKSQEAKVRVQLGQKDFVKKGLIISSKYLFEMEDIFLKYNLPGELTRLPLVESSFNEDARSKAGASGVWQFVPWTGKTFLYLSNQLDERNSPFKATEAAAKLLKENFQILKSWPLAITAFNHGTGSLLKAIKTLGSSDLIEIIAKYNKKPFGFASQNYYCEFLAILYVEKYQNEIFQAVAKQLPLKYETVTLKQTFSLKRLIEITKIEKEQIQTYNPDLSIQEDKVSLPKGYQLYLPVGSKARLELFQLKKLK